ncbi:MAG: GNAT family N-acetyltransferase [Promethearchaeota archaeon]
MNELIRAANLNDLETIMVIERESFPVAWEYSVYLAICMQKGRVRSSDRRILFMDVLEKDGEVIGYTVWEIDLLERIGHILNLAISKIERRRGYGRMLLDHTHERFRDEGMASCYLEVRESNSMARSLYESSGYTVSDKLEGYYFDEDALVYTRNL